MYALGATLAYAATGHTTPERDELPAAFRTVVSRCLSRDPGARPPLAELIDALADGSFSASVTLLGPGWLPGRVIAALAYQSAAVLTAEIPVEAVPVPVTPSPSHSN